MEFLVLSCVVSVGVYCQYKIFSEGKGKPRLNFMSKISPWEVKTLKELREYMEKIPTGYWSYHAKNLYELVLLEDKTLCREIKRGNVSVFVGDVYFNIEGEGRSVMVSLVLDTHEVDPSFLESVKYHYGTDGLSKGAEKLLTGEHGELRTYGAYIYASSRGESNTPEIAVLCKVFQQVDHRVADLYLKSGIRIRATLWKKGRYVFLNPVTQEVVFQNGKRFNGVIKGYTYEIF